jgi:hypothetical protein
MKADIQSFVQACVVCQQAEPDRAKYPGLLQPLHVPSASWEVVPMDFVEGLPKLASANAILVVVDKFSKIGHFIPLRHPFTAATVAKVFRDNVYPYHGLPSPLFLTKTKGLQAIFGRTVQAGWCVGAYELRLSPANQWPDRACELVFGNLFALFCSHLQLHEGFAGVNDRY